MTFYLLYPAALENVIICLDSVEFLGYNWRVWWCFVIWGACRSHNPAFLYKQTRGVSLSLLLVTSPFLYLLCLPLHLSLSPSPCPSSGDMLDLLKWRAHPERINDSLSKLKEIDGSEIVKVGPQSDSWPWTARAMLAFIVLIVSDLISVCVFF